MYSFNDYIATDNKKYGGCLTRAIYKVLSGEFKNEYDYNEYISNGKLRDLIMDIRDETKIFAENQIKNNKCLKNAQLVDFHETLERFVYFKKNNE